MKRQFRTLLLDARSGIEERETKTRSISERGYNAGATIANNTNSLVSFRDCCVWFLRFLYATEWQRTQSATEPPAVTPSAALLSLSPPFFKLFIAPIWRRKATKLLSDLPSTGYVTSHFLHRMSK